MLFIIFFGPLICILAGVVTSWNWNVISAFTAIMAGATAWMAYEAQITRNEALITKRREAFKSALVEIADRNHIVIRMFRGLSVGAVSFLELLLGNAHPGIEYFNIYPETLELLKKVEIPVGTSEYVLSAIHKIEGLVSSFEKEARRDLELKTSKPSNSTLDRLLYLHLILIQLGRTLLIEAGKLKVKEVSQWKTLLEVSSFVGNIDPEKVTTAIQIYPPIGELVLPSGDEYKFLDFSNLIQEGK